MENNFISLNASASIPAIQRWVRDSAGKINEFIRRSTPTVIDGSGDLTTSGNTIIIATAAITVTLSAAPSNLEEVTVKRATTAGNVVVDGGAKNIDGDETFTMLVNYDAYTFIYSTSAGEWLII